MAARVYATPEQVQLLVGVTASANTLRRASRAVDRILKGAVYDVDEDGMPTSTEVADLLAEMVAEQVAWYEELGDETGIVGMSGGSIGQVTLPQVKAGASHRSAMYAPNAVDLARDSEHIEWRVKH